MWIINQALINFTIPNKFPILIINEIIDKLNGAYVYSKLDLHSSYHQVCVADSNIHKIAFKTHEGNYKFMMMLFGLINASSAFQSLMNSIIKEYIHKLVVIFLVIY